MIHASTKRRFTLEELNNITLKVGPQGEMGEPSHWVAFYLEYEEIHPLAILYQLLEEKR